MKCGSAEGESGSGIVVLFFLPLRTIASCVSWQRQIAKVSSLVGLFCLEELVNVQKAAREKEKEKETNKQSGFRFNQRPALDQSISLTDLLSCLCSGARAPSTLHSFSSFIHSADHLWLYLCISASHSLQESKRKKAGRGMI